MLTKEPEFFGANFGRLDEALLPKKYKAKAQVQEGV
jgi:hypothetical protein